MSGGLRIVCATRHSLDDFDTKSALGRSLQLVRGDVELSLFPNNRRGLPEIYNIAIRESVGDETLVFVHDDVYLCDFFWQYRIESALKMFQVVGLAGNRRRVPYQPSWAYTQLGKWDSRDNLSGVVGHGKGFPCTWVCSYGELGVDVKLLDGLFLAARSDTLLKNDLLFDERFDFHCYDMDFSRSAELKGVSMGTWPISVVHESDGSGINTPEWGVAYAKYLEKWTQ